ncbi:uncharacterized protein LOC111912989 [Lactuca sativa]|uniref:uncharacterized protein LOC111912989 n=1 Tax=Lactuca sativa TaxID=4236 RepID=UPI000CC4FD5F|nr:uncharacterized protein LOC111912989 [Lactuca sativa]
MDSYTRFNKFDKVRVTGGNHEGEVGLFLLPLFSIMTAEGNIINVKQHFVEGYNNTPMTPIINVEPQLLASNDTTTEVDSAMPMPRARYKSRRRQSIAPQGNVVSTNNMKKHA